jgi:hypothetical protein
MYEDHLSGTENNIRSVLINPKQYYGMTKTYTVSIKSTSDMSGVHIMNQSQLEKLFNSEVDINDEIRVKRIE